MSEIEVKAPELKPCPFCGNRNLKVWDNSVSCRACDATGPDLGDCFGAEYRAEAIESWNRRAETDPEPVAYLVTVVRTGEKRLQFRPIADLPYNRDRFISTPLFSSPPAAPVTVPATPPADRQLIEALVNALEPFADHVDEYSDETPDDCSDWPTFEVGDFRRARSALAAAKESVR